MTTHACGAAPASTTLPTTPTAERRPPRDAFGKGAHLPTLAPASTRLPPELWAGCFAFLDRPSACAVRSVSHGFREQLDLALPGLFGPRLLRQYQGGLQSWDPSSVARVARRARALSFSPYSERPERRLSAAERVARRSEPARIWQMVAWAPGVVDLAVLHSEALDPAAVALGPAVLPSGLERLTLHKHRGGQLRADVLAPLFDGRSASLKSLALQDVTLLPPAEARPLGPFVLPALTSLTLEDCEVSSWALRALQRGPLGSLQTLRLRVSWQEDLPGDAAAQEQTYALARQHAASLRELSVSLPAWLVPSEAARELFAHTWPALQSFSVEGTCFEAAHLVPLASPSFPVLEHLALEARGVGREHLDMFSRDDTRRWRSLEVTDLLTVTLQEHDAYPWFSRPAFSALHGWRVTLQQMRAATALEVMAALGPRFDSLALDALELDDAEVTEVGTLLASCAPPPTAEVGIPPYFLDGTVSAHIFRTLRCRVWVEAWENGGYAGFEL